MKQVISVSGKRKRAIARAFLKEGRGIVKVNNTPIDHYMPLVYRMKLMEPLILARRIVNTINIQERVASQGE